jgi:hypothetical protein
MDAMAQVSATDLISPHSTLFIHTTYPQHKETESTGQTKMYKITHLLIFTHDEN